MNSIIISIGTGFFRRGQLGLMAQALCPNAPSRLGIPFYTTSMYLTKQEHFGTIRICVCAFSLCFLLLY
jgi:hypothetical protein